MSIERSILVAALSARIPAEILDHLLDDYLEIKRQFFLRRFRPSELNGGRFSESMVRLFEYLESGNYTPYGRQIHNSDGVINRAINNVAHPESIRFFVSNITRVMMQVRNRRDVAHVGGAVSPNFSDALFVCHCADWILTEVIRHFYSCSAEEARKIVQTINEIRIPIVTEVDGFVRVQNTDLEAWQQTLVVLYYKQPSKVRDADLAKWILYQNLSRYQKDILPGLHRQALIHYSDKQCSILEKGILYIEKNIPLEMIVK